MKLEEIDSQQNLAYLLRTFNGMPLKRLLETREEMRKALRITEELGAFISGKHDGKPDEDFYHDLRGTYGQMEFLISELARNRTVIVTDNGKTVGKFDMTDTPGLKKALEAQEILRQQRTGHRRLHSETAKRQRAEGAGCRKARQRFENSVLKKMSA